MNTKISTTIFARLHGSLLLLLFSGFCFGTLQAQCPINAAFTATSVYVNQGQSVTFTNTSTGVIVGNAWSDNGTLFSTAVSPSYTFSVPGLRTIRLINTNGTCTDTATTLVMVSPTLSGGIVPTNPICFNGTNGSANLTPAGGHQNICLDNNPAIFDYTAANAVTGAGYTGGISVEAWVKPRATWTTGDGLFFAFNNQVGTFNRFFVGYNAAFQQFVYFDDNLGNQFQNSTSPRGAWHHVVVTISSANVMSMYVNGILRKQVTTNANWIPVANELFSMGQEWDNAAGLVTSQHFDGQIDEARIWNTVLSPATVTANFSGCMSVNSSHPNWANLVAYYSMNEGSGSFIFDRSGNGRHGARVNGTAYGTVPQTNWGCFSSGTGYGYTWSNGATTQDISAIGAGTYTVTVIDGGSSTVNVTTTLTNPAQVVVALTPPGPVQLCAGLSTSLTASGASTYAWSPATGLSGTTGSTVTATPASTITYTCVGTNGVGCTGTSTVQVVVNPLPVATITGSSAICIGQSTTLLAGGGSSYVWSNGPIVASNTVAPTVTTTYTVTATNSFNCIDTEVKTVTVNPLPVVSITGDTVICVGETTLITAGGGTGYVWSNGPATAANSVSPTITTNYVVTVTDGNTCQNSRTVPVTVNPLPILTFSGIDTICTGDTTQITVAGALSYAWGHGPTTALVDLNPGLTTFYDVLGIDANGCVASDSVQIVVNPLPIVAITGTDTICDGDTTALLASGGSGYSWSTGDLTALINVAPSTQTIYSVSVTDANSCVASGSITVEVNALPTVTITGNDTLCAGDSTLLTGAGASTYLWSTGDLTALISVTPSATTTYVLTGTDGNGCNNDASIDVVVNALPVPIITGSDSLCIGDSTTLTASGGATYFWDTFFAGPAITVTPVVSTTYSVTATDVNGCEGSASQLVVVSAVPSTPVITQVGNTMSTTSGLAGYQWFFNGVAIPGANSSSYVGTQTGNYTVIVNNAAGCDAESAVYPFIFVGVSPIGLTGLGVAVYPNPNDGRFTLQLNLERDRNLGVSIYDLVGKQVWSHVGDLPYGEWKQAIDLSALAKGTYLLQVVSEGQKLSRKIVVQ